MTHPQVRDVWARIVARTEKTRAAYLDRIARAPSPSPSNLAHVCAACSPGEKNIILAGRSPNIGIITAYNDIVLVICSALSASRRLPPR